MKYATGEECPGRSLRLATKRSVHAKWLSRSWVDGAAGPGTFRPPAKRRGLPRREGPPILPAMTTAASMGGATMAEIAALVGDPARANILDTLIDGRALTATELAFVARVSPSTASAHLAKLTEARLLSGVRQGRNRYYRLASPLRGPMPQSTIAGPALQGPPPRRAAPAPRACDTP